MKRQNTRRHVSPLYIVQQNEGSANEDDSDSDISRHYYYGPHNERLPGPPQPPPDVQSSYQSNNTRLPYLLPPLSSGVGMPSVHQRRGRFRIRVHLEYGYIVRKNPDNLEESTNVSFNIKDIMNAPNSAIDLELRPFDEIVILSNSTFTETYDINVTAAVRKPWSSPSATG